MQRALAIARRGSGLVSPNPLVGAVVVRDGAIVGAGWHERAGGLHAEAAAILNAGPAAQNATLYVTLEPCNHYGRTPPCTNTIIEAGIREVVFAARDPNPRVKGGGRERLREAGVIVREGLLAREGYELNRAWMHWVTTGLPFVVLKLAVSLDGRMASPTGDSKWISSQTARAHVQRLRRHVDAVLVGSGTVLADNPRLTNRTGWGRQPLRVILDSFLQVPPTANVYRPLGLGQEGPVPSALVVTTSKAGYYQRRELELAGAEVLVLDGEEDKVDLPELFRVLGKRGIQSIMCEGGARLATTLLSERLCHRLLLYHGALLIGEGGRSFFEQRGIASIKEARRLTLLWARRVGRDVVSLYDCNG